jgi:nucleoside-diphosphate-sugar epimerase
MAETICRVAGLRTNRIYSFPWWAVRLAAPFVEVCREMLEMRYLWRVPAELDNTKLLSVIGGEPHTPLEEAVTKALAYQAPAR